MPEHYKEIAIIRHDNMPETETPTFDDTDVDAIYQLSCRVQLVQILKSVQNSTHNKHDYVFKIVQVTGLQKE